MGKTRAEVGVDDLATMYPEILKKWDFEKNIDISPYEVLPKSSKKVWWKCEKGHSFEARIAQITTGGGCPYCTNKKVLRGYNDLATTHSDLVKEWHPTKNLPLTPYEITYGSEKKVYWL